MFAEVRTQVRAAINRWPAGKLPSRTPQQPPQGLLVMSILKNPIFQAVLTVLVVIVFCKYFASKIPVVGSYISIT
jgi:hypothetical protein